MKQITNMNAFTLIEVLLAISLLSIIIIPIYNVQMVVTTSWEQLSDFLTLKQQGRIIMLALERELNSAAAVKLPENDILMIKQYQEIDTDYYLQFVVRDKKLNLRQPLQSSQNFKVKSSNWPTDDHFGNHQPLTEDIIKEHEFILIQENLLYYNFELEIGGTDYVLENKAAF